ncbi:MAG: dihydrofolate reductase [Thermoplasmata archaeon]|nr:dihydrofolate reductase [Thermoplasmata archaeon]
MRRRGPGRRRRGASGEERPGTPTDEGGDEGSVIIVEAVEVVEEKAPGVRIIAEDDADSPNAKGAGSPARAIARKRKVGRDRAARPRPVQPTGKGALRRPEARVPAPASRSAAHAEGRPAPGAGTERRKPFMTISMIAAVSTNNVIGNKGRLPWDIPADMERFKRTTMGHSVIMGRKTWESMGRALEGRDVFVLSRNEGYRAEGATVANEVVDALIMTGAKGGEVFVAGGGEVYHQFLPLAERLYITAIVTEAEGDTNFPKVYWEDWREVSREKGKKDHANHYDYWFLVYER